MQAPLPSTSHPVTTMQTIGPQEQVMLKILEKYYDADSKLQAIITGRGLTPDASNQFVSAVLAEYRMIRPKLGYANKITKLEEKQREFQVMKIALDRLIENKGGVGNNPRWYEELSRYHLLIGEFIELDGISRFECEVPDLSTIFLQ